MAGLVGRTQMVRGLKQFTIQAKKTMEQNAQAAAVEAAISGEIEAENIIATYPSGIVPGKVGRIWTGKMYESMDADVKKVGRKITAKVGWLKIREKYFLIQEDGGNAFGHDIIGMHALTAAQERMKNVLAERGIR